MDTKIDFDARFFHDRLQNYLGCQKHYLYYAALSLEEWLKLRLCGTNGIARRKELQKFIHDSSGMKGEKDLKRILREVGGIAGES